MNKNITAVLLVLVSGLNAQLPIPSWVQWLSDDEKSLKTFTTIAGCEYEEIDIRNLNYVKEDLVRSFLKQGIEFTENDLSNALEYYWINSTKHYPLKHIQDGYKMIKIIDASAASDDYAKWGKVVVWEWQYTLKNVSENDLTFYIDYTLTDENFTPKASDGKLFYLESGGTGTYSSTSYLPIDRLADVESRKWKISLTPPRVRNRTGR